MEIVSSVATQPEYNSGSNTAKMLRTYLDIVSFRHKILSKNIANVNTPGYKADEVRLPQKFADLVGTRSKKIQLKATSTKHIVKNDDNNNGVASCKLTDPFETKPNGNNVSLTQQLTKISQNQTLYDTALKAYASSSNLVSTILGK